MQCKSLWIKIASSKMMYSIVAFIHLALAFMVHFLETKPMIFNLRKKRDKSVTGAEDFQKLLILYHLGSNMGTLGTNK